MNETIPRPVSSPLRTGVVFLAVASLGYLVLTGIQYIANRIRRVPSYPPGPPRLPLVGALTSFPKDHFYRRFSEWSALYGDIVYAPVLGMNMVILNSHDAAQELLTKRPNTTAGRHVGYLVGKLMGTGWSVSLLQPGHHHTNQRKMLRRGIGPQRIGSYDSWIESSVAKLMPELENFQGNPKLMFYHTIGHMVTKITYGEKIWDEMGSDLVSWNVEVMDLINEAFFGSWLVDFFRILRFVPDWIPGLRFKRLARDGTDLSDKVRYRAYTRGLELYKAGTLGHCILNDLLEESGDNEDVRDASSNLYGAAADTTTGAVNSFLLVLFLYPEVSQRVFEEIQSVTHGQRLLKIADRANLPYTEAVFKESVRIRHSMPLSIPHVNTEDEIIRGYFIPKGTIIHQCTMAMFHDPKVWKDPEVFRPERFLGPEALHTPDPLTVIFGYGTRVCPGMYLANKVAFYLVATISSLFNVLPPQGKKIPDLATLEWEDIAVQQPLGFECRFTLRDETARHLLTTVAFHD
ncbi:cytochrome P450 [Serendipita vermifera]|nr:cytochrome P450 [Serendipita vermifera]